MLRTITILDQYNSTPGIRRNNFAGDIGALIVKHQLNKLAILLEQ